MKDYQLARKHNCASQPAQLSILLGKQGLQAEWHLAVNKDAAQHLGTREAAAVVKHAAREHADERALTAVHVADDGHAHLHTGAALRPAPRQHLRGRPVCAPACTLYRSAETAGHATLTQGPAAPGRVHASCGCITVHGGSDTVFPPASQMFST